MALFFEENVKVQAGGTVVKLFSPNGFLFAEQQALHDEW